MISITVKTAAALTLLLLAFQAQGTLCSLREYRKLSMEQRIASPDIAPSPEVKTLPIKGRPVEPLEEFLKREEITFLNMNVENYFITQDPNAHAPMKSEVDRANVAKQIVHSKADVITLEEVGGPAALEELQQRVNAQIQDPRQQYEGLILKTNDQRGIYSAVLIRKGIPLEFELSSHRYEPYQDPLYPGRTQAFSRDLPTLIARLPGEKNPLFIVGVAHFKSKLTEKPEDPMGGKLRGAESNSTSKIVQYYEHAFPGVPIFIGGDWNGEAHKDPEFAALRDSAGLVDAFDAMPEGKRIPSGDPRRTSYVFFAPDGSVTNHQLDAWMLNKSAQRLIKDIHFASHFKEDGSVVENPATKEEQEKLETDHRPAVFVGDLQALLKAHRK